MNPTTDEAAPTPASEAETASDKAITADGSPPTVPRWADGRTLFGSGGKWGTALPDEAP